MKRLMYVAAVTLSLIALIVAFVVALWSYDVWKDRRHTVRVESETPVFAGSGVADDCTGIRLTSAQTGTTFRVRRIRYWKACATIDVVLPDGSNAHLIYGVGKFSISPPLN
jgi:hypothetical protein